MSGSRLKGWREGRLPDREESSDRGHNTVNRGNYHAHLHHLSSVHNANSSLGVKNR